MNCWEYKDCTWTEDCPAYPEYGDCCNVKFGTLCCEDHDLSNKITSCKKCSFYKSEYFNAERAIELLGKMKGANKD